jgi:hypothetical protein
VLAVAATASIQQFAFDPAHFGVPAGRAAPDGVSTVAHFTVGMPRADEGYWP